jgi:D-alanyl-D-alanine carboxypeptidase
MRIILFLLLSVNFFLSSDAQVKHLIQQQFNSSRVPGMVYAVVKADTIIEMHSLGFRRADKQTPEQVIQINDWFLIGSNTKAMTAYLAGKLVEKGALGWDTRLVEVLPHWQDTIHQAYQSVTLWQLLTLTAGVPAFTAGTEFAKFPKPATGTIAEKRKLFAQYVLQQPPVNAAGVFHYSNASYSIAALMLETVTGNTWENLLTEELKKEGIQIQFGWPNRIHIEQPWGHWALVNNKITALSPTVNYRLSFVEPAGDVNTGLPDYIKWIQLHLKGLQQPDNLLMKKLHDTTLTYAGGWAVKNGVSYHNGSDGAFYVTAELNHKNGIAFIMMANCGGKDANELIANCLQILREAYPSK